MLRFLTALVLTALPMAAHAVCEGQDLLEDLTSDLNAAALANAAQTPYHEGLLWQATRGDRQITLFGTYHYRHDQTDAHLEHLKPLIDAADVMYLEASDADQKSVTSELAEDPSLMFIVDGPTLPDLLGENDWSKFAAEMTSRQIPSFMAAKFKPLWGAMMLGIGPCEAQNGALEGGGIDALAAQYAESNGTPTRSLEDFKDILTALDELPLEKQVDFIRLTLALPVAANDLSYTVRNRYLLEQTALIWEFNRLMSLEHGGPTANDDIKWFERILLTDRNRAWVDILAGELVAETIMVAVGAAHLPGENGVLRLLEEKGFTIRRLSVDP